MTKDTTAFDPQTPSAEALSAAERAGARVDELIHAWREAGNAAAIVEVAEAGTGAARKAARRALNVLRSRGVPLPERRKVAQVTIEDETQLEAWMAPPDGALNLVLVVARWPKARRGRVVFAHVNDAAGLLQLQLAEIAQSGLKAEVKRLFGDRSRLVKVPVEWARARIAAARAKNAETKVPLPLGLTSAADLLEPVPSDVSHPFDEEGLDLADEDAKSVAEGSALLHQLPEFGPWLPSRQAAQEMLFEIGKDLEPGAQPDEAEMRERVQAAIRSATDRYFSPQIRERLVTAMKDSALSVLAREGEVKTLEVVAAIKAIQNCGLITDPPHEVPFLRAFFEKALQVLMAQNQGQLRVPVRAPSADAASADQPGAEAQPAAEGAPPASP
ncbi:MAG: hypothetical protein GX607_13730 [Myxococcales bacterium]|nr:hypothetical protein [Myxococcales bacterium]